jgi:hypothetical protein
VKYSRLVLEERSKLRQSVGLEATPPARAGPPAQRAKADEPAKAESSPSRG